MAQKMQGEWGMGTKRERARSQLSSMESMTVCYGLGGWR